ncbi:alpha-galactosidase [Celerinatantimonas sp. YJH-8]|uniref:alpha-galactosidase n=1 Tax=Celerinatantimonas sp. YJH-8 TaxID=3228714 RepID=UPI0038C05345
MKSIVRLQSQSNDIVIRCAPRAEIIYWGPHLTHFQENDIESLIRPIANGRLDVDTPITLAAENGSGLFGSPGLEGHRHGQDAFPIFTTQSISHHQQRLVIEATDEIAKLRFTSEFYLDPDTGVLQLRNGITNLTSQTWQLERLAVTLPIPERASEVMAFHGRWLREFQPHRVALTHGSYSQESRRGRTSHEYFPAMIIGEPGFNEQNGAIWALHLGWSGNHRIQADVKTDGRRLVQAEALYFPGEIELEANDTHWTPWVYATYSGHGLNHMSQQYHSYLRHHIIRFAENKPRPVHLNTWEGIYFDHDPEYIMQMATKAAQIGVERFIIDDGWFKGRHDDQAALGDWYLDTEKYPNGLTPIIDHVRKLGMEFGIWFEPEMINKNSMLYQAHPDWLLELPGYDQPTGRYQYVLDLSNDDVFRYLLERLTALLNEYPVDYIKWDMNRELVQPCHQGKPHAYQQTLRFYELLDILHERFPNTEIESCASGGGRIDYEVLKRTQRFWASDNNDALERQTIQKGMSYFFPPEVMGAHIGNKHCHATRRQHSIEFRGITALFGHMGIELDPVKAEISELDGYTKYVALHKQFRSLIHSGQFWRVDMSDPSIQVQGVVSPAREQALFSIAQLAMPDYTLAGQLRFPGLAPDATYKVTLIDHPDIKPVREGGHTMRDLPIWMNQSIRVSGEWLMTAGLSLPILDPETAILISLTRQ